jgi:hypothetical protein
VTATIPRNSVPKLLELQKDVRNSGLRQGRHPPKFFVLTHQFLSSCGKPKTRAGTKKIPAFDSLVRDLMELGKKAGVPNVALHRSRDSYITDMARTGNRSVYAEEVGLARGGDD